MRLGGDPKKPTFWNCQFHCIAHQLSRVATDLLYCDSIHCVAIQSMFSYTMKNLNTTRELYIKLSSESPGHPFTWIRHGVHHTALATNANAMTSNLLYGLTPCCYSPGANAVNSNASSTIVLPMLSILMLPVQLSCQCPKATTSVAMRMMSMLPTAMLCSLWSQHNIAYCIEPLTLYYM